MDAFKNSHIYKKKKSQENWLFFAMFKNCFGFFYNRQIFSQEFFFAIIILPSLFFLPQKI